MYISAVTLLFSLLVLPDSHMTEPNSHIASMPKVFEIGQYEWQYEQLTSQYETSLLEICDNDMRVAFQKLSSMYQEMEIHASNVGYDVAGIRSWLHVFWGADGSIEYLGFHLRPNSKNVEVETYKAFLLSFVQEYRFPLFSNQPYSLYTSVSFPVSFRSIKEN